MGEAIERIWCDTPGLLSGGVAQFGVQSVSKGNNECGRSSGRLAGDAGIPSQPEEAFQGSCFRRKLFLSIKHHTEDPRPTHRQIAAVAS